MSRRTARSRGPRGIHLARRPAWCPRCDWQASTRRGRCPRCRTDLHRHDDGRPSREPGSPLAPILLILVLASVVTRLIPEPAQTTRTAASPPAGRLVYASATNGAWMRLWVLDLGTGRVAEGPRIRRTGSLLALPAATGGTELAYVARTNHERQGAFVLRRLERDARPTRVGAGDLVAWDPGEPQFAAVTRRPEGRGCDRATTRWVAGAAVDRAQTLLPLRLLCRGIGAIQQSGSLVFYELASPTIRRAPSVGLNQFPRLMTGYRLVSASPQGVVALTDARPPGSPAAAVSLIYRAGSGLPRPLPLTFRDRPLSIDRALAWSSRSDLAFTSRIDGALFLCLARLGTADASVVRSLDPLTAGVGAAFDGDDRLYFSSGGSLFMLGDRGSARQIAVPKTAPAPVGPLAWIGP